MAIEAAKDATGSERDYLTSSLRKSLEFYLAAVADIPESAASACPAEGKWSALQVTEHISNAEHGMLSLWIKTAAEGTTERELDKRIPVVARDRSNPRTAPERARPTGRHSKLSDAIAEFKANREKTIAALQTVEGLRTKRVEHPLSGHLDGYQLMLLIAGHTERHVEQIKEIKNSAAYQQAAARGN